jgi:membrane-associated phospholipid phosphatase
MENKMKNKWLWLGLAIFVALMLVFSFTDWQISQTLYNPDSGWATFMEAYGQLPGSFLGFLCGSMLIRTYKIEKSVKSILGLIGLYLLSIFAVFGFFSDVFGAQVDQSKVNLPAVLVLTVVSIILAQIILHRFSLEAVSQYKSAAKVGLALVMVGGIGTVWLVKIPWGRWTYRDILEAGKTALFTPWFLPQGNNGHHSFFSGHTALCFSTLPYLLFLKKGNPARLPLLVVLLLWGVIGGLSRIVVGAHYASDVLVGACQTLLWFWVFNNLYVLHAWNFKWTQKQVAKA